MSQIMDSQSFSTQLDLEKARTDRTNLPFAFVVFSFADNQNSFVRGKFTELLAETITSRTRESDVVGWYESAPKRVGLLLGNITQLQTSIVIHEIEDRFRSRLLEQDVKIRNIPRLECEVYLYPSSHELFKDTIVEENAPQFSLRG